MTTPTTPAAPTTSATPADPAAPAASGEAFASAGWHPQRDAGRDALLAMLETVSTVPMSGEPAWEVFPAAEKALREFHGLRLAAVGPGIDVAATGCTVDPRLAGNAPAAMGALAEALGARLFPFGRTEGEALLAVDEAGRLFSLDHSGWWLLGDSAAAGLTALLEGGAPRRVKARRWRWEPAPLPGDDPVADLVKTAMVLVFVLHRHGVLSAAGVRVAPAGEEPGREADGPVWTFPLRSGSLESNGLRLIEEIRERLAAEGAPDRRTVLSPVPAVRQAEGGGSRSPLRPRVECTCVAAGEPGGRGAVTVTVAAGTVTAERPDIAAVVAELESYAARRS